MEALSKYLENAYSKVRILSQDIDRMLKNKKEGCPEDKPVNLKSFQPITKIRASKQDAIKAKQNPEVTFVMDRISEIFRK